MAIVRPKITFLELPSALADEYRPHLGSTSAQLEGNNLIVIPSQYAATITQGGEYSSAFNSIYRTVKNRRVGFTATISDGIYPLYLLFKEIQRIQGSTIFSDCWKNITVRDSCQPRTLADLAAGYTTRKGAIEDVTFQGDGRVKQAGVQHCDDGELVTIPKSPAQWYCPPFDVVFLEEKHFELS